MDARRGIIGHVGQHQDSIVKNAGGLCIGCNRSVCHLRSRSSGTNARSLAEIARQTTAGLVLRRSPKGVALVMRKIECKTEGCTSYYDGEFPDNDWACRTCRQPPSLLFVRTKKTRQDVLRSESTNRTRVRYWMRWLREQAED